MNNQIEMMINYYKAETRNEFGTEYDRRLLTKSKNWHVVNCDVIVSHAPIWSRVI